MGADLMGVGSRARHESVTELFQPDVLTASQYADRQQPSRMPPYRALRFAVLEDAWDRWVLLRRGGWSRERDRELAELERWFASDSTAEPFAVVNLCEEFGIDVAGMRAALERVRPPEVVPPAPADVDVEDARQAG